MSGRLLGPAEDTGNSPWGCHNPTHGVRLHGAGAFYARDATKPGPWLPPALGVLIYLTSHHHFISTPKISTSPYIIISSRHQRCTCTYPILSHGTAKTPCGDAQGAGTNAPPAARRKDPTEKMEPEEGKWNKRRIPKNQEPRTLEEDRTSGTSVRAAHETVWIVARFLCRPPGEGGTSK